MSKDKEVYMIKKKPKKPIARKVNRKKKKLSAPSLLHPDTLRRHPSILPEWEEQQGEPALDVTVDTAKPKIIWPNIEAELDRLYRDQQQKKDQSSPQPNVTKANIALVVYIIIGLVCIFSGYAVGHYFAVEPKQDIIYRNPQMTYDLKANPFESNKIPLKSEYITITRPNES